jgi:hypothetical protein
VETLSTHLTLQAFSMLALHQQQVEQLYLIITLSITHSYHQAHSHLVQLYLAKYLLLQVVVQAVLMVQVVVVLAEFYSQLYL